MAERVTVDPELGELYRLGETLPQPLSRAAINGYVATRGLERTRRRLIEAHLEQCTTVEQPQLQLLDEVPVGA